MNRATNRMSFRTERADAHLSACSCKRSAGVVRNLCSVFGLLILLPLRLQSSPAPSSTPPPIATALARTPPTPHRESPMRFASHPQNSALHTRTLHRHPTIPHNSAAWESTLPPLSHDPRNSHTQTPPAAL